MIKGDYKKEDEYKEMNSDSSISDRCKQSTTSGETSEESDEISGSEQETLYKARFKRIKRMVHKTGY